MEKYFKNNRYLAGFFYFYLFIAAVILLLYGRTLYFGFTWFDDDWLILSQASYYANQANLLKTFSSSIIPWEYCYYRPFLIISFFADYFVSAGTMDPVFYHFNNIILHICSTFLLFYLLNLISISKIKSAAWSLIFACHPALTQAVAWIPGRNDSLLALFVLLSFIFYVKALDSKKIFYGLLCVLFWAAALFTKENAIVLPLFFILYLFAARKMQNGFRLLGRNDIWIKTAFFLLIVAVLSVYIYLRTGVLGKFTPSISYSAIILNMPAILTIYIGKIFIPVNLSVIPFMPDSKLVYGLSATAILSILFLFVFKIENKRLFYFGLAWFFLFLLPALIPLQSVMLEHRLYLPLIGLIISLGQISIPKLKTLSPKIKTFAFSAVFIFFFITAFKHSSAFSDPLTFWQKAASSAPSYYAVYTNLGKVYLENELNLDMAEVCLIKADEMRSDKTTKENLEKIHEIRNAGGIEEWISLQTSSM